MLGMKDNRRTAIGLFLICFILLGFWWYELNQKTMCEAGSGKWEKLGPYNAERCNPKTTDAGKICTDTSECQGACLVKSWADGHGFCSDYRYFPGCAIGMYNGTVSELCWK